MLVAVSTSIDSNIRVWDLENEGKLLHNISASPGEAWTSKCSPDGTFVASGSYAGNLNIYNIESGEQVSSLSTKQQFTMSTAYVCV
jgi:WD repeat-containing protein 61